MSYATKAGKAAWAKRYRECKRVLWCCRECSRPSTHGGLCEIHLQTHRLRSRRWMRQHHGHQPRYENPADGYKQPYLWAGEFQKSYYETDAWGQWRRVSADFRDPLTILLEKERRGEWQWRVW